MDKMKIGEQSDPRFEFRTFGQCFCDVWHRMSRLSVPVPEKVWERKSDEIYIVSRTNNINNTKIRDGKIDIKTFVRAIDGLEQWNPLIKGEFPLRREVIERDVIPAFMVPVPRLEHEEYGYNQFVELVRSIADLSVVRVHKQRFGYMVNNTISEVAVVMINGARVMSVNSESTNVADVLATIKDVGLSGVENINYLQAIKRVIGMIDRPLANEECSCHGCHCCGN